MLGHRGHVCHRCNGVRPSQSRGLQPGFPDHHSGHDQSFRLDESHTSISTWAPATAAGGAREWMIETDGTSILTRSGWSRDAVAVGDVVTVRANPDRNDQRNHALLISMARADGVVLRPRSGRVAAGSRATSVSGVWDGLRGFGQRRFGTFRPTAKGMAAMKAYTDEVNPVANCVPFCLTVSAELAVPESDRESGATRW